MRIDIVTGLPKLLESPFKESILKRAQEKGVVDIVVHDLRSFAHDRHKTIDDTPYGGGAGMVLKPEPIFECVEKLQAERVYDETILLTADGEKLNQRIANELSALNNLILICGHYKGVDDRVRQALVSRELSIGDFVLTGGELAAAVVVDAVVRLIPGVLNDGESALSDSFQDGMLGAPQYTKPADFRGMKVPDVLLRGNHSEIEQWRDQQRVERTKTRRNDLMQEHHH
ncbi:MAG: tRNA (guanosine(37)-N1)-methyltransferase TrmD [Ignavibacteriales bacterium]|nr:tRNA (guanosine(37)-N1)-methyltransferase TrmD [Ignavibacteriales bacterium]